MTSDDLSRLLAKKGYSVVGESKPKPAIPSFVSALMASPAPNASSGQGKRIRQHSGDGMNSWERAYKAELERDWKFIIREISLPLANGARYKVDFMVARGSHSDGIWSVECHEVKGRALSTGILKVKVAASLYPFWKFRLVTKRTKKQGGGWAIEEVLP